MAQNDILEGLSIEGILADVKAQQDGEKMKLWSMAEIDALLGDDMPTASVEPKAPVAKSAEPPASVSEQKAEPVQKAEPKVRAAEPVKQTVESAKEAPKAAEPTPATASESYFHREKAQDNAPQEPANPILAEEAPLHTEKEIKAAKAEKAEEFAPLQPAEPPRKFAENSEKESTEKEITPIAPMLEGTEPQEEFSEAPEEVAETKADIRGQISIEKTRLFNEVEAHAVHRADVPHHIGRHAVHEPTPASELGKKRRGMEEDKNRSRFLNRPRQELEKTKDHRDLLAQLPPQTIEKPGVIVQNAMEKTQVVDGLQAIPTLVTPEDALKAVEENTRLQSGTLHSMPVEEVSDDTLENQIMLEGFNQEPSPVEIVDEEEAELDLYERRQKKAESFKLFPGLETEAAEEEEDEENEVVEEETFDEVEDPRTRRALEKAEKKERKQRKKEQKARENAQHRPRVLREFYGPKDEAAVLELFGSEKRGAQVRMIVALILTLATTVSALLVRFTGHFDWVGGTAGIYSATSLLFLLILAGMSFPAFKKGFLALKRNLLTAEFGLIISFLLALLQVGLSFVYTEQLTHIALYTPVAAFGYFLYYLAKRNKLSDDIQNFHFVAEHAKEFYAVSRIEDEETAFEIGRGLLLEDPDIRYNKKIAFPQSYVEVTKEEDPVQRVYNLTLPVLLIAGAIIGGVTCFLYHSAFAGLSALTITVLGALPVAALLGSNSVKHSVNKQLKKENALLSSFEATEDALSANAVALDAADLFNTAACRLSGMKLYHKMRVDEALLYTAAMVIQSGGTLSTVFDKVILKKREILPTVESLAYEERLGCSGWIYNQRVLVGSRDLLQKHNVQVPPIEEERRFKKADSELLYLAVEGKVAALFVVTYASNVQTAAYLQRLEKYGVNMLVRTSDPNITESLVEQTFHLPNNLIKILNPVAGKLFRDMVKAEPKKETCGILHCGASIAGLRALLGAFVADEKYRLMEMLLYIGTGLSVTLMAVLCFFSGLAQAGAAEIVFFQVLWMLVVTQIPKIKKL